MGVEDSPLRYDPMTCLRSRIEGLDGWADCDGTDERCDGGRLRCLRSKLIETIPTPSCLIKRRTVE
jgi:hypothetical protein